MLKLQQLNTLQNLKKIYYEHNGFLPLDHKAAEAQVDLGECSFIEKGEKIYGKYLVMTFTHSNSPYIQLLKNKMLKVLC